MATQYPMIAPDIRDRLLSLDEAAQAATAGWLIDLLDGADPVDEAGDSLSEAMVRGAELSSGKGTGLTLEEFRKRPNCSPLWSYSEKSHDNQPLAGTHGENRYHRFVQRSDEDQCYIGYGPNLYFGGFCHAEVELEANRELCTIIDEEVAHRLARDQTLPTPAVKATRA